MVPEHDYNHSHIYHDDGDHEGYGDVQFDHEGHSDH